MIDIKALAAFLTARLDEREEAARAAADGAGVGPWKVGGPAPCECCDELVTDTGSAVAAVDDRLSTHIALHDPAWVLADVEARRVIIREAVDYSPELEHGDNGEWAFERVLCLLALPYGQHPDYKLEWGS